MRLLDQSRGHLERQRGVGVVSRERVVGDVRERRGGGLRSSPSVRPICMQSPSCVVVCCLAETAAPMVFVACTSRSIAASPSWRVVSLSSPSRARRAPPSAAGSTGTPARLVARRNERRNPGDRKEPAGGVEAPGGGPRRRRFGIGFGVGAVGVAVPGSRTASVPRKRGSPRKPSASPADAARRRRKEEARDELGFSSSPLVVRLGARVARAVRAETSDGRRGRRGPRRSLSDTADAGTASSSSSESTTPQGGRGRPRRASLGRIVPVSALARPRRRDGAGGGRRRRALLLVLLAPHAKDVARRARRTDPAPRARRCGARRGRARGRDRRIAVGPIIRRRTEEEKRCSRQTLFAFFRRTGPR